MRRLSRRYWQFKAQLRRDESESPFLYMGLAEELIERHIYSLRQKIELDPQKPTILLNVRGVGYRLAGVGK